MDPLTVLALAQEALKLVPVVIQLGQDASPFIAVVKNVIDGTDLTADQRASIDAEMESLHAQIQAAAD